MNDKLEPKTDAAPAKAGKASVSDLRAASENLKAKIEEAKARNDAPLDAALGNPKWERAASDGHLDIPEDEDE